MTLSLSLLKDSFRKWLALCVVLYLYTHLLQIRGRRHQKSNHLNIPLSCTTFIKSQAFGAIRNLSFAHEENRRKLGEAGVCEALVDVLQAHGDATVAIAEQVTPTPTLFCPVH
jgi:hypothetical protein